MEVFLNIIIFFVLFLLVAKMLFRYLMPWLLRRFVNRRMKEFGDAFEQPENQQSGQSKSFGDIKVDYVPPKQNEEDAHNGEEEYVDFEEIDDKK